MPQAHDLVHSALGVMVTPLPLPPLPSPADDVSTLSASSSSQSSSLIHRPAGARAKELPWYGQRPAVPLHIPAALAPPQGELAEALPAEALLWGATPKAAPLPGVTAKARAPLPGAIAKAAPQSAAASSAGPAASPRTRSRTPKRRPVTKQEAEDMANELRTRLILRFEQEKQGQDLEDEMEMGEGDA